MQIPYYRRLGHAPFIMIRVHEQRLYWAEPGGLELTYPVSTAIKGIGQQEGSEQTPSGLHRVAARLGLGERVRTVFQGRCPLPHDLAMTKSRAEDPITSRILWLEGLEPGWNRGGNCDSYRRYIYIHGTLDEETVGLQPTSRGCIRMRNEDVIDLFARTPLHTLVMIDSKE